MHRAEIDGRPLVFFGSEQVCPDPARLPFDATRYVRSSDGSLLELPFNPSRGSSSCGRPCGDAQRQAMARFWQLRVHLAARPRQSQRPTAVALPLPQPVPVASLQAVVLTRDRNVWAATRDAGVYHFDGQHWRHFAAEHGFDRANPVLSLAEDGRGAIWIASMVGRNEVERSRAAPLWRFHDGVWRAFRQGDGLPTTTLYVLAALADGVAVGGNTHTFTVSAQAIENRGAVLPSRAGMADALTVDSSGGLWLAHGVFKEGLTWLGADEAGFLTSREGLFGDRPRRIAVDDRRRVWLLADDGRVAVYDRTTLLERLRR